MWNEKQEEYLKDIGEQAMCYTWMQEQTAMYYSKVEKVLGILIIILSGILGTNNFINTEYTARAIAFGIIGYLTAILGMISQYIKPQEASEQRKAIANKFQDIYYDIKQELAKGRSERMNVNDYIKTITQRYIELYDFSPSISNMILSSFKKKFKNSKITMPLNMDIIEEIKIMTDEIKNNDCKIELQTKKKRENNITEFQKYTLGRLQSNT